MTYGINYRSALNDIEFFHVINHLPQDIMHVLLEGVPHEMQLMLYNYIVVTKLFTLETLNNRISSFCYSTSEARDRQTPITYQAITKESFKTVM